jgi:predicted deacylase
MAAIDLITPGKRAGKLWVWAGSNESAYRNIAIPLVVVVNGMDPTTVVFAGVHGDEYEGQVILNRLAERIEPDDVKGRVILVPTANPLACETGQRYSSDTDGNLFRGFGGDRDTPVRRIAAQIETHLLRGSDLVIDLHSGGRSLAYDPCSLLFAGADDEATADSLDAAARLDLPFCMVRDAPSSSHLVSAARRCGAVYVAAELGGAGGLDRGVVQRLEITLARLLREGWGRPGRHRPKRLLRPAGVLLAEQDGIFEPFFSLGDRVEAGALAGRLHRPLEAVGLIEPVNFDRPGIVVAVRPPAFTRRGDCLAELAS